MPKLAAPASGFRQTESLLVKKLTLMFYSIGLKLKLLQLR